MSIFTNFEMLAFNLTNKIIGAPTTYTPAAAPSTPKTINAVFEMAFVEAAGVQTQKPTVRIYLADLLAYPQKNDTIVNGAISYKVEVVQPDSFGGATLVLKKA